MGDANFDGVTDASDFNIWNSNKFTSCGTWSSGDFNGDTFVDGSDFNLWNSNKFQSADAGLGENTTSPVMSVQADGINESRERSDDRERTRSTTQLIDRVFAIASDSVPGDR